MTQMRKYLLAAAAVLVMAGVAQADSEPYVAEIQTYPFNFCPKGWLPTDGRLMAINQNTALFSLLGTTYGGDGVTNFRLPNRTRVKTLNNGGVKVKECIAIYGIFPSRP